MTAALASMPGDLRIQPPPSSEPVRVNGRAASYSSAYRSPDNSGDNSGVRMAYGEGGVLDVVCDSGYAGLNATEIRTVVLDFAGRLRFSTGDPLLLPVTFARLPSDLKIIAVQYQGGSAEVVLTSGGKTVFPRQGMVVSVRPLKPNLDWKTTTIDGEPVEVSILNSSVSLCRPVQSQFACVDLSQNPMPPEEPDPPDMAAALVTDTMRTIRLASDVTNRATWFEAHKTLPS